jgi:hypothetical protein
VWPAWVEPLRPDEMSRRRLKNAVLSAAVPMLRAREWSWQDVAGRWAAVLAPIAAGLTILFAGLAYSSSRPETEARAEAFEVDPLFLQPMEDGIPALLTSTLEPSMEGILAATIGPE